MRKTALITAAWLSTLATSSIADVQWGANGHPITAYPGIPISRQLDYIADLGMTSYRVNVPDLNSVHVLEELVREGKKRDVDILPVITPATVDLDKDSEEELYNKSRQLAFTLGSRFKDDIRAWELGNEMENYAIIQPCETRDDGSQYPCEWGAAGGVHADDYYGPRWAKVSAVLRGLSDGMTEADPDIRKAMGTAGWGHVGAFDRMQADGIEWDISVWHMYGDDPEWAFKKLARYGKPIWVTEFNNPYGSQRSEQQQADGLRQSMLRLRQLGVKYDVELAHIYELLDEPYWAPSYEAFMGLVSLKPDGDGGWQPGEPKPAYAAVREISRGKRPLPYPTRSCDIKEYLSIASLPLRKANFAHCLLLGRPGNPDAMFRWAESLDRGDASHVDMMMEFYRSEEFHERHQSYVYSDMAFLSYLYRLILGREADPYGFTTFGTQLERGSMTREMVAFGMILSQEFNTTYKPWLSDDTSVNASVR